MSNKTKSKTKESKIEDMVLNLRKGIKMFNTSGSYNNPCKVPVSLFFRLCHRTLVTKTERNNPTLLDVILSKETLDFWYEEFEWELSQLTEHRINQLTAPRVTK